MGRKRRKVFAQFEEVLSDWEIVALTNFWAEEAMMISKQGADSAALVMAACIQIARLLLDELKDTGKMRENLIRILATPGNSAEEAAQTRQ